MPKTVRKWRARWATTADLAVVEADEPALRAAIAEVLADVPRPGAPVTFTTEQIVQIITLACTPPANSGRPVNAWTSRELADEAQKRQIVSAISPRSVGRFLKAAELKPHDSRYGLNTTEPDPVAFAEDVETICTLYG